MKKNYLNHVAILVKNIEQSLKRISVSEELVNNIEEFPSEGTRELYIGGKNQYGRILLMQAIGDGPYKQALTKRGPGLHHIAIDVDNIDFFLEGISGSGWLLHPRSIYYYKENRQLYLSRPGIPTLIEVQERKNIPASPEFLVTNLSLETDKKELLESLNCVSLTSGNHLEMKMHKKIITISKLVDT